MDVIGEEEDFGDLQDIPTDSSRSINGEQQQIEGNSISSGGVNSESDSEEFSEYETDFAKRLKMQQKQVLNKDGTKNKKKTEDFSKQLQKHRNDLVNTWEEDHQQQQEPNTSSPDQNEFGTFEDAKQIPTTTDNVESFDSDELEQFFDAEVNDNVMNGTTEPGGNADNTNGDVDLALDIPDVSGDDLLSALDEELKNIEAEEGSKVGGGDLGAEEYENLMNGCLTTPSTNKKIAPDGDNIGDYGDLIQSGTDELMTYVDNIGESSTINKEDSTVPLSTQSQDGEGPSTCEPQPTPSDTDDNENNVVKIQEGETTNTTEDSGFGDFENGSEPTDSAAPSSDDGTMTAPPTSIDKASDIPTDDAFNGMDIQDAPIRPLDQFGSSDFDGTPSLSDGAAAAGTGAAGDNDLFSPITDSAVSNNNTQETDKSEGIGESDDIPADNNDAFGEFDGDQATEMAKTTDAVDNCNDFGDFGAAPSTGTPDATNADDDFGDFDTAQVVEKKTEDENDKDFGDFGAAPSSEQVQPSTGNDDFGSFDHAPVTETAADSVNNDDFGGLDTALPSDAPDPASVADEAGGDFNNGPTSEPAAKESDDDNDFGDFDAAPSSDAQPATAVNDDFGEFDNAPVAETSDAVHDNGFGDFDAAPSSAPPATDDNDFGDFDNAPAMRPTTDEVNDPVHDDDFGGFDAAPPSADPPGTTDNDEFGDFGNAPAAGPTKDAVKDPVHDDDFGDFDAAPPSSAGPPANTDNDDFGDFDNAPAAGTTNADDDFGDFDAAPPSAAETPARNDNDDFGDFDTAPTAENVPSTAAPESTDDDDWGEFDDAPTATPVAEKAEDRNLDDDFENFDAAPPADAPAASTDDDDWGDFDDAPAATPTATGTAATASAGPPGTAADDDFGDFDDAPAATEAAPPSNAGDEEFGDFGAHAPAPSTSHEVAPPVDGPELQRARAVFAPMQGKYVFDDLTDDAIEQNLPEELAKASIQNFLTEHEKGTGDPPSGENNEKAASSSSYMILKEMLPSPPKPETQPTTTSAASQFIVKNDGRGSYYHFAYPIGGLRPPRQEDPARRGKSEELQGEQNSTASPLSPSSKKVPVVLSIELPTGNEVPLSVSSPKKSTPKKVKMTQESLPRNDAPLMPTLHGGRNMQNGGRPADAARAATFPTSKRSDAVEELAAKIPDLNFMLQAKLVLPQKK